jgi:hypothetical protein
MVFYSIRAYVLKRPEVSFFDPVLCQKSGYTEGGAQALVRSRFCALGFIMCWLLSVLIGVVTGSFVSGG